ncbi:hypothetical protein N7463_005213 [Penicillium fimorum]|uniref:Uncharacterized protein n=1 Tax=Penicillium fimorum TaxID=1882269 RepID=A0A9X0C4W0_9EURO|nr:hypothetical protein N7463_005213 [Penicillium fimorum]
MESILGCAQAIEDPDLGETFPTHPTPNPPRDLTARNKKTTGETRHTIFEESVVLGSHSSVLGREKLYQRAANAAAVGKPHMGCRNQ